MSTTIAAMAVEPLQNGAGIADPTTIEWTRTALLGILGYGLLAGVGALSLAFGYRALTVRQLPIGPAVLVGLALPAGWLTGEALRHGTVIADSPLVHYATGSYVLGVLVAGGVVAGLGHRLGDHLARGTYEITAVDASGPVADLVQSAGLAVAVTLPASIDDAEGYPAVDEAVKRDLADRDLQFPSGLSTSALRSRLERRLESDYDLGYVRAELAADGGVAALTIGARRAGIGPTLGPDRVAVAIAGDPSSRASAGDPVEVWTDDDGSNRLVTTGTLRASADPVTTLIVDADDAEAFEPGDRYRLTTRPETPGDAHALVSAIRTADETVTATTVAADGPLESEFAGWVSGTVLAIDREGEELSLPADNEPLEAGDTIYVFGTPAELADRDGSGESSAGPETPEATPGAAD
ncbi:hypothetical protein ACFO5R_04085 [Halosolutus amylolyticus]|uniref:RCK C-terminal domain-containing protein n=1 Tax=Halosolutus amylolyticus TaxID=2932267 RepID=A0ABD5PKW8_9EURY|nr:TrkA C-terminal domain-containing protein [Halosolutus amylolyticus]